MQISFIIPAYNVAPYLAVCVRSVAEYKARDIEIIVVDDGSTDGTPAICDALAREDARVVVIHQANAGVSAARNAGLDRATGKWICFVDGDDRIFASALDRAQKEIAGEDDILFFSWHTYEDGAIDRPLGRFRGTVRALSEQDIETIRLNTLYRSEPEKMAALGFQYTYSRSIWGCLWRAEVIEKHHTRFTPGIKLAQDVLFRMTCLKDCHRGAYIDTELYAYRMASGSATHKMTPHVIDVLDKLYPELRRIVRDVYGDEPEMLKRLYAAYIMESRRLIDLYLNHPDCPLSMEEKATTLNRFLVSPLMRESLQKCDGRMLIDPVDRLYDAYRLADPDAAYQAAVRAVKQQSSHSLLKKALGSLGLLNWAKYSYRRIKRALRRRGAA